MRPELFYRTYLRFARRSRSLRLKMPPFGMFTIGVCIVSGLAGLNIFSSELYRIFTLSFSLLLISYIFRKKPVTGVSVKVFFDKQYIAEERSNFGVRIYNDNPFDLYGLELIPVTEPLIPDKKDFLEIKEPGEEKRNIWDRNVYYFRWQWHQFRKHKAEFDPVKIDLIRKNSFLDINYPILPVRRGKIRFEGFYVLNRSVGGLFYSSAYYASGDNIIILPKKIPEKHRLRDRVLLENELAVRGKINISQKHKVGDFIGLREYVPGDPYRNIHWKTWAKTGKPAVVEKGVEKIREITVLLINNGTNTDDDLSVVFEDLLSGLFTILTVLEENDFITQFIYFDSPESIKVMTADSDKGNYSVLYNFLSDVRYFPFSEKTSFAPLKKISGNRSPLMVFSVADVFENIEGILPGRPLIKAAAGTLSSKKGVKIAIPAVNTVIEEINLT